MSEQAAIPHSQGEMSQGQAIERMLAKAQSGQIPEPKTEDQLLDERDPESPPQESAEADPEAQPPPEGEPQVEGDEFSEEPSKVTSADPLIKFDDGTEMALSEVKRGFLRQQDYTRKTQEVSQTKKAVEAERQQYLAEKQQVADRLGPLIQQARSIIDSQANDPALAQLREVDPGAYAVRMMEIQQRREALARAEYEQQTLRANAEREQQERFVAERRQQAEQSRASLIEAIPAAKKDFGSWYSALGEYVLAQGVPAEIWDNEVDHRVITLAWKAMQYDNATRKAPATKEQLRKAPQPLRPGAARPPGYAQDRMVREATEKAHKSGSIEDAIKAQMVKLGSRR